MADTSHVRILPDRSPGVVNPPFRLEIQGVSGDTISAVVESDGRVFIVVDDLADTIVPTCRLEAAEAAALVSWLSWALKAPRVGAERDPA